MAAGVATHYGPRAKLSKQQRMDVIFDFVKTKPRTSAEVGEMLNLHRSGGHVYLTEMVKLGHLVILPGSKPRLYSVR